MKIFLFYAAIIAICAPALRASTILSENFDELTPQLTVTSAGAFTAINGTNVDIVGGAAFPLCNGPESGSCLDLNGTGGNSQGQLQSTAVFAPGNYLLSFDLIGDQRGSTASATVSLGNYSQTFTLASGDLSSGIVTDLPVTITTPSALLFTSGTAGPIGLLLDNVVLSTGSTVPEPTTLTLMGLALILGAVCLRRWSPSRAPNNR